MSPTSVAQILEAAVNQALPALSALAQSDRHTPPAPGKWTPQLVIGHLIDSAANNHQRFVRVQQQTEFIFPGYQQDRWVSQQAYQESEWEVLLTLWSSYNRHLAHLIRHIPETVWTQSRHPHNLHQIAFKTVAEDQPTTLGYFVCDYVAHLEHHLKALLPDFSPQLLGTAY